MKRTEDLSKIVRKNADKMREAKEKLYRALRQYLEYDYLTNNELDLMSILEQSPSVKMDCRDLIKTSPSNGEQK